MITHASIISESESITILCLLCSSHYTAVRIKNCSKSTSVITVATMKNMMVLHAPGIIWKWSIHCPAQSALHSSMNQEVFKKYLCNKSRNYEKYGWFLVTQRKPSHATTKLTLFTLSKIQSRELVSPWKMHFTYCGHLLGWSDVEQWKNQAYSLSRYRVTLVWRHQAVW